MPVHIDGELQEIASPYILVVNDTTYGTMPLKLTVSAVGPSVRDFMAFMLQARSEFGEPAGHFSQAPVASKPMTCYHTDDTLTHTAAFIRPSMEVLWHPPGKNIGRVAFTGSIAVNKIKFWAVQSDYMKGEGKLDLSLAKLRNGSGQVYMLGIHLILGAGGSSVPVCSPQVGWVPTVQQRSLYLSDPAKSADLLTWEDARHACQVLNQQTALASCPRDIYDQTISCTIEPSIPYWVGITAAYPSPDQIYWVDGSLETRASQFSVDSNLSPSVNQTCGYVNLTIHSVFHRPLDWTLSDCSIPRPFICLLNKAPVTQSSSTSVQTSTPNQLISAASRAFRGKQVQSSPKIVQNTMTTLKCSTNMTPLSCLMKKISDAHTNASIVHKEGRDIVSLAWLIIENIMQTSIRTANLKALLDFLRTVDVMLQMMHMNVENSGMQSTEEFIGSILTSGSLRSNYELRLTHVDLSLVHVQLYEIPGRVLEIGSSYVKVENYSLMDSNRSSTDWVNQTVDSSNVTSQNSMAVVAVVLLDVPKTAVDMETKVLHFSVALRLKHRGPANFEESQRKTISSERWFASYPTYVTRTLLLYGFPCTIRVCANISWSWSFLQEDHPSRARDAATNWPVMTWT
ncbi:hypothetical protein RRG08_054725 [Elysia crispata]|uniref:C-type lectin domain-containing protein n=1 Tax=Elysia crispata TaxID=231223 RepID=A0AAE1B0Z7_9GAST|nr:hypothetical protein RRG08_054725 [Elysia crispata]